MKITDNMLRVINHAYITCATTEFLIKTNIMQLKDKDIIVKAVQVADMINKLIQHIDTETEKRFYAYLLSVEDYNKELIKERNISKDIITLKEFILGNGLVYSEFLDYVYDSLAKYKFTTQSRDIISKSLDKTHSKLKYILQLKGGVVESVDLEAMQIELEHIDFLAKEYYFDLEEESSKVELMAKTIKSIKDTIGLLGFNIAIMPTLIDPSIRFNTTALIQEVDNKVKDKLEGQANSISNAVMKQLDCINITYIERRIVDNIEESVNDLVDNLSKNIISNIGRITTSNEKGKMVEDIVNKVNYLLNTTKGINSKNILENVAFKLDDLYNHIEDIKVNNKAYEDLIEFNLDNINRKFR